MGNQGKAKSGQHSATDLHSMRRQAHEMGIPGNSKMNKEQLQSAIKMVNKGTDPATAKQKARGGSK